MTLENLHFAKQIKKTLDKWKRPLFSLNIFKIFFIHFYKRVYFFCIPRIHISLQSCNYFRLRLGLVWEVRARSFFPITRKMFQFGTCHFKTNARNIKAIFRGNFSSQRFYLRKISKIKIFTRGPRTTYCTNTQQSKWTENCSKCVVRIENNTM